ncbi:EAL domain-containing protein [Vibrio sp. TH_r3]|uniref:EAL domain-containing protein n=1 Tax=Vibrio sp. TH_r3 TaxID=3082084 RepID=UPI002953072F|nr:EAL domain-containing protein [Vibrio sp. TH_r3]MDV7105981.1 EAL domain-containing protein [Vibrio sp. TH_r3]
MSCKELYLALDVDGYESSVNVDYKLESIVDFDKNIIGYECLVNARRLTLEEIKVIFYKEFSLPFLFMNLMKRIKYDLKNNQRDGLHCLLKNRKLFINIERSCVCNRVIINEIIHFKKYLMTLNIELVLEVTEREASVCWACSEIYSGLSELSKNQVLLAVDDYDIYNGDFRSSELSIYNYIKIEVPKNENQYQQLDSFIRNSQSTLNIVIERIESQAELTRVTQKGIATSLRGFQGFVFGKPLPINI